MPNTGEHWVRARQALAEGDLRTALIFVTGAVAEAPGDAQSALMLSDLLHRAGHPDQASRFLRRIDPEMVDPDGAVQLAMALAQMGFDDAATAARATAESLPEDVSAQIDYAVALVKKGEPEAAEAVFLKAAEQAPESPDPLNRLAWVQRRYGRFDAALGNLEAALSRDPNYLPSFYLQGQILVELGQYAAAETAAREMEKRNPDAPKPGVLRALIARETVSLDESLRLCNAALALGPDIDGGILRVALLAALHRVREAELAADAIADQTGGKANILVELALALLKHGCFERAGVYLDRVIAGDSAHLQALILKSMVLNGLGQAQAAEHLLVRLVATYPSEPQPRQLLIEHLGRADRPEDALQAAEAAIARLPDNQSLRSLLAQIQLRAGQRDLALESLGSARADGQLTRRNMLNIAWAYEVAGDRATECQVLSDAIDRFGSDDRLIAYIVKRCWYRAPSEALLVKLEALSASAGKKLSNEIYRELLMRLTQYDRLLAFMQQDKGRLRSLSETLDIARCLIGLHRPVQAERYLRLCRRRWPNSAEHFRSLVELYVQTSALDQASALVAEIQPGTPEMKRARLAMELLLLAKRARQAEIAIFRQEHFETLRKDMDSLYLFLRHARGNLQIDEAEKIQAQIIEGVPEKDRAHWRATHLGQMMNELHLMALAEGGNAALAEITRLPLDALKSKVRQEPHTTFLASHLISWIERDALSRSGAQGDPQERRIPRQIYQFWDAPEPPRQVEIMMQSWADCPGHTYTRFSHQSALRLFREEFGPSWVRAFCMSNKPAEQADFLRLCLLARKGGIWCDADDLLVGDLDSLIPADAGVVLYREPLANTIENNFIAARPKQPILVYAAGLARDALLARSSESVWGKTGPGLLTRAVGQYLAAADPAAMAELCLHEQIRIWRDISTHNHVFYKTTSRHWSRNDQGDPVYIGLLDKCLADNRGMNHDA